MNLHNLMCPHCHCGNATTEEPREGVMYACGMCETAFKVISVNGEMMTANAGDDPEEVLKKFQDIPTIFDLINIGRNRGVRIESNPTKDNWVGKTFMAPANWRESLPLPVLLACTCDACKKELARRQSEEAAASNGVSQECPANLAHPHCGVSFDDGRPFFASRAEDEAVPSVPEIMAEAAETFKQRNALYGDSYKHFHEVMQVLFPEGLTLKTDDEWRRFGILFYLIGKVVRYCNNFTEGGHVDSAHDSGVYSFMLEELTRIGFKEKGL